MNRIFLLYFFFSCQAFGQDTVKIKNIDTTNYSKKTGGINIGTGRISTETIDLKLPAKVAKRKKRKCILICRKKTN
jgi:hypothetical protein